MQHITEYRNQKLVKGLLKTIRNSSTKEICLMEVCGGHTMSILKFGIPSLLPGNIKLLSGPGCPVCVTDIGYIDKSIALSHLQDVIVTTYGDLIRVPGSSSSLEKESAKGHDIRIVYSLLNALEIAKQNPMKKVVFLAIGFETTAPGTAATVLSAAKENIKNFFILSAHKIMPPALQAIIKDEVKINGYICPGHVSTITGTKMYQPIVDKYKLGCVISGFEPTDILWAILRLVEQFEENNPKVENAYPRAVKPEGNLKAQRIMKEVFLLQDTWWRGFGIIEESGLFLKPEFAAFDADLQFDIEIQEPKEAQGCICGEILKGLKTPKECPLFRTICHPANPVGACMVSNEGACNAYYRFSV
ncbi:MAG: hydrogenase formation protein HypD [Marinifilaceae bacterium]